jgi:SAM-dependent methyltransferase
MAGYKCRVCDGKSTDEYVLTETMFGTLEEFRYFECGTCGCLQICEVPHDLSRHYRSGYYSFSPTVGGLRKWLKAAALRDLCGGISLAGRILNWLGKSPVDAAWLRACGVSLDTRILDVGCGGGERLLDLHSAGFRHLAGVDPFVDADVQLARGVTIRKAQLAELTGQYDLIMLHHSFEHLTDPAAALGEVVRLLAPSGTILIRIPVMGCWAWRHYGRDWVQLDPPRHLFLFTAKSIQKLADAFGLQVHDVVYDSTDFQFDASEKIRGSKIDHPSAHELNMVGDGDQACFVLRRNGQAAA